MPIPIQNLTMLREYLDGLRKRADHHAPRVDAVAPSLLGYILAYADLETIRVREYSGSKGNVLWTTIHGKRYAWTYKRGDPKKRAIALREGTIVGKIVALFSDDTTHDQIREVFDGLA